MGWATGYIERLKMGETITFRPRGNSMKGKIESGQLCTVESAHNNSFKKGDIVLCEVDRAQYLHLVKAIQGERYQIGNNQGRINGWINQGKIYGKLVSVAN